MFEVEERLRRDNTLCRSERVLIAVPREIYWTPRYQSVKVAANCHEIHEPRRRRLQLFSSRFFIVTQEEEEEEEGEPVGIRGCLIAYLLVPIEMF